MLNPEFALSIVFSFSSEFVVLGFVSLTVAFPFSKLAMLRWLDLFAYRIDIGILPLFEAAFIAFAIAVISVSSQAYQAARVNPTTTLRCH